MSVVSDTTAITTLLKAGQSGLRRDVFGRVFVPPAVWDELREFHATLPDFVERRPVRDALRRLPGTEVLGRGEAEALVLAEELNARLLLTDGRKARVAAQRLRIPCAGLVGVIVHAKRLGRIHSVREMLDLLETRGGLYLSDALIAEALRSAGET